MERHRSQLDNGKTFKNPDFVISRSAMTILEVMLALVILGGSVAVVGELSRQSLQNARNAADLTQAQLLAESILAKVRLGIIEQKSAYDIPVNNSMNANDIVVDTNAVNEGNASEVLWLYSLEVTEIESNLLEWAVTVRRNLPQEQHPAACRLVRWAALDNP
ncbi:MAG: hypothetical protein LBT46_14985 [Planctomycetaceae bacterium]|jgi:type II secretory pathway pseudopilin PulG|nr:hypothetical protein [Planctomycetaceae bacterium]